MIKKGKSSSKFYKLENDKFSFKTKQEFEVSEHKKLEEPKTYRKLSKLEDLINYYSFSVFREQGMIFFKKLTKIFKEEKKLEKNNLDVFIDFLKDLLIINPLKRVTANKAITHPFIIYHESLTEKINVKLPYFENLEKGI